MKYLDDEDKARLVKDVIDNFDFQTVDKVMTALDWKWWGKKPSIRQMQRDAEEFLYHVLNNDNCISYGSGGFMAYRYEDSISLAFIVDTAITYFDED